MYGNQPAMLIRRLMRAGCWSHYLPRPARTSGQPPRRSWPKGLVALALLLLDGAGPAVAAPIAQGFELGPGRLFPSLGVEMRHESNFFRVARGASADGTTVPELGTWISVLRPQLSYSLFRGQRAARAYRFEYNANIGTVYSSRNDDYIDQRFNASANWERNISNRYRFEYEFLSWHDRRGSGDPNDVTRANFYTHPDLWQSNRLEGGWSIGRPGRTYLLDMWLSYFARRYTNNDQSSRDDDRLTLNGTLSRAIAPKTRALLQFNAQNIHYVNQQGSDTLDSEEYRLYTGLIWDRSRKTSFNVRGGWLAKDFQSPQRQDVSDFGWEATIRWRPQLERNVLDLETQRLPRESADGIASTVVISSYRLNWLHYLVPNRHYYQLGGFYTTDDYVGENRTDHRIHLSAGLYGQLRRRAVLGLEYQYQQRDSNIPQARYDNDVFMFTLDVRL